MIAYGKIQDIVSIEAAFEAAKTERAERNVRAAEVRREAAMKQQAKNLPGFVAAYKQAAAAQAEKQARAAELTAELQGFVDSGCKAVVTKDAESGEFHFSLQRFAGRRITSNRQLTSKAFRRCVLRKDGTAFDYFPYGKEVDPRDVQYNAVTVNTLYVSADKAGVVSAQLFPVSQPAGRLSPYLTGYIKPTRINYVKYERFTKALLNVAIDSRTADIVAPYLKDKIYELDGRYYVADPIDSFKIYDLLDGEPVGTDVIFKDHKTLKDDVVVYGDNMRGCMIASNGQIKNRSITFPADNLDGFNFYDVLNKLTFGLLDRLTKKIRRTDKAKKVAQLSTRLAQIVAPAVEGKHVDVFAVYMGIYNPLWDGEIYIQSQFAAHWIADRVGVNAWVDPRAVLSMTFQCRPYMCKGNGSVISREYFDEFFSERNWGVVVLERSKVTEEEQNAFDAAVWSKGQVGPFAGKLVIICDSLDQLREKGIQVFTDLNGLKETFDVRRKSGLNVLDVTEDENGRIKTSTQAGASYLVADQDAYTKLFNELAGDMIDHKVEELMADVGHAPRADEFHDGTDLTQMIVRLAPKFAREAWGPTWKHVIDQACKGLSRKIGRCNVDADGCYEVLVVDPSIDFGFHTLEFKDGVMQVYCKAMHGHDGVLKRYPKANAYGVSVAHPVTADDFEQKAKEADLNTTQISLLLERVNALPEGAILVPASQDAMDKHDGWDYDGDHVQIDLDPRTVEIVKKTITIIVHIVEDDDFAAKFGAEDPTSK